MGEERGTPVSVQWIPGNPLPKILPAFFLLALFLFKKNRTGSAWLVFLPFLFCFVTLAVMGGILNVPSEPMEIFSDCVVSVAYALTALWLLSFLLARQHLVIVFLGSAGILLLFGAIRMAFVLGNSPDGAMLAAAAVTIGIGVAIMPLALVVAGWRARRQYRPFRFALWTMAVIFAGWFLVSCPFFLFVAITQDGWSQAGEFCVGILVASTLTFAVLLPFLMLSFTNGFYRARLKEWLHLEPQAVPPVAATSPPPETNLAVPL